LLQKGENTIGRFLDQAGLIVQVMRTAGEYVMHAPAAGRL
jgi:hypothetical protein